MQVAPLRHTGSASERIPGHAVLAVRAMALFVAVWVLPAGTVAAGEAHGLGAAMFGSSPFETADVRLEEGPLPADDTHTTPPSTAAPPEATTPPAGPPPPHTGVKATLKAIPGDFRHLPSMHSLAVLAGGGALALAARPFDKEVNGRVRGSSFVKTVFAPGKFIGQGATLIGTSFAVYGIGRATDNRRLSHLGMDLLRSTLEDAVIVYGIKAAVRRDRPTGECCSFPSGHASVTFAAASVLWRHLGWKAAVPTYTVASYVALSRLHDNRHYLSDVVFGSALGVVVGHTVTMHTLHGHETWAVTPMPIPGGMGVMVSFVK